MNEKKILKAGFIYLTNDINGFINSPDDLYQGKKFSTSN
jgi:hypothetical protein